MLSLYAVPQRRLLPLHELAHRIARDSRAQAFVVVLPHVNRVLLIRHHRCWPLSLVDTVSGTVSSSACCSIIVC